MRQFNRFVSAMSFMQNMRISWCLSLVGLVEKGRFETFSILCKLRLLTQVARITSLNSDLKSATGI